MNSFAFSLLYQTFITLQGIFVVLDYAIAEGLCFSFIINVLIAS